MIGLKRLSLRAVPLVFAGTMLIQPVFARISEQQCDAVRAEAKASATPWIGLNRTGELTPLKSENNVEAGRILKIVYLHHRDDGGNQRTVIAVKLTFHTEDNERDKNWVRVKNNLKNAFTVAYDTYQKFHGGESDFSIRNNFHLSKGIFHREIPFSTFDPAERRSQLRFADIPENAEQTFRSYLLAVDGIPPAGGCVDFAPTLPNGTKVIHIEVIDLLENPEAAVFYHKSIDIKVQE